MRPSPIFASLVVFGALASAAAEESRPTADALVALKRPGTPAISPDGRLVAYTTREVDWTSNEYVTQIWLADVSAGTSRQLTRGKSSSEAPAWSPDGRFLAFASSREAKRQVYRLDISGGDAESLSAAEEGILEFAWSPDGTSIAYTAIDPKSEPFKAREKRLGEFDVHDRDQPVSHLHLVDLASKTTRRLTSGAFAVGRFAWSPDSRAIAFDHRPTRDLGFDFDADVSIVTVADGTVRALVTGPGLDATPIWSPDGKQIAFTSTLDEKEPYYYSTSRLALVDVATGAVRRVPISVDESPILIGWGPRGIYFWTFHRTWAYLYTADPSTGATTRYAPGEEWIGTSFSLSRDFATTAFIAADRTHFTEIFVSPVKAVLEPTRLSDFGAQVASWPSSTREVVGWKSQDGASIEGVLHKPAGFTAGRRYPLLVVVHGGPASMSRPIPYSPTSATYPIDVWLGRGAIVLEPNYRGSSGYGEAFRKLNIRNLGLGDAWDVLSGIDALVAQGIADNDRVGVMGWSQGGYISAFLTLHDSARFKAVSVGAGISDWMTYYVNTDIHPFTRRYLKATPWDDPAIYAKTSPITYAKGAKAPTLVQHGAVDPRVPVPNAFELYQAIADQGVPARLITYKNQPHSFTTPKANLAVMEHNLEWFGRYLWGDP
ncbi:MAG: S9 family peptidase [Vicinamibacterales bacterium]